MLGTFSFLGGEFKEYGLKEIIPIILLFALPTLLFLFHKRITPKMDKILRITFIATGITLEIAVRFWFAYKYGSNQSELWSFYMAPFHLCSITMIFSVIMLLKRSQGIFEVIFYWGIAGAFFAITFPNNRFDISFDLRSDLVRYIHFYVNHLLIAIIPLYAFLVDKKRIRRHSVTRAVVISFTLAFAFTLPYNLFFGTNFMFTRTSQGTPLNGINSASGIGSYFLYLAALIGSVSVLFIAIEFIAIRYEKKHRDLYNIEKKA